MKEEKFYFRTLKPEERAKIKETLSPLSKMYQVLRNDVRKSYEDAQTNDQSSESGYYRRVFVRAALAFIEGQCYAMRRSALISPISDEVFSADEISQLQETVGWLSFKDSLKVSFPAVARSIGLGFTLDTSSEGFAAMMRLSEVRHRLMHPKLVSGLLVSDKEMQDAWKAFLWFSQQTQAIDKLVKSQI